MIVEALKFLAEMTSKADAPKRVDVADPRKLFLAVGGQVDQYDLPPPPRAHKAGTLDEVVALANRFAEAGSHPVVWYDEAKVVLVLDDDGHRVEHITLALERSDVFAVLLVLRHQKPWYDQRAAIRLVRIDLAGTMSPAVLLDRLRKVKIENGQAVTSEARHARESLGRSINAAVSGEAELPEGVVLDVPVYKTPGEADARYPLSCSIEIDPLRLEFFRLLPYPDEMERVGALAVAAIGERLREELSDGVPCYQGQP